MPVATVQIEQVEHKELKTLPEKNGEAAGWVELRRMTYGQKLTRSQSTSKMSLLMQKGKKDVQGQMEMLQVKAAMYDFSTCVIAHNLTDPQGQPLNFQNPQHVSTLDPRVGEEIATYIDQLNNFEEDDELGNSENASDVA